ncbi:type II toxin-antitoxin system Phd/YefM family antitoxin [Pseudomonas sp. PH1b]|uniref:type II toxin-antitoxin system Phd/YefM family antitoxin n=1 Tax=Pseudomonas sp. PH1b TaxID=1397282 RepID=UPI0004681DA2|nr:type II toxin-antitoxin system Phd/YefM family antitoxin [Pseudomonas sp. PH1b]
MKLSSQIKLISYLKNHTAEIAKQRTASREPQVVTQNAEAKRLVMDVQSFEKQQATLAMLRLLALGHREIEAGQLRNTGQVFAEQEQDDPQ